MENEKSVYVVGGGRGYYSPFAKFGEYEDRNNTLSGAGEAVRSRVSLVLFTGGSDVDPALYGEQVGDYTHHWAERDRQEIYAFHCAHRYGLPMVGVCRGAQFLCVMSGGKLVQHVECHGGEHPMELFDGRVITVSSTHHQMQLPLPDATVLGWPPVARSAVHLDGQMREIPVEKEVEIAHYPTIRALAMQHHPEMMHKSSDGFKIAAELVQRFLLA
jgi:gamma-glutamyl-gamma-aminobutyrate hydrolase PuuD